jgi:hypothetical protein
VSARSTIPNYLTQLLPTKTIKTSLLYQLGIKRVLKGDWVSARTKLVGGTKKITHKLKKNILFLSGNGFQELLELFGMIKYQFISERFQS